MTRRWLVGLVAVACLACGGGGGSSGAGSGTSGSQPVMFKETEYSLSPDLVTLKPGSYTVTVQNVGQFPHDLHIATSDGSELGYSTVVKANETASFKVNLQQPGTYKLWCAVNAHDSLGMHGTLTVQ